MTRLILRSLQTIVCAIVCGANIQAQQRYAVVISEIMADPTPVVGLPDAEWIELTNRSSAAISLAGWRLAKPTGAPSGPMPAAILQPDSSVIVCTASQVAALSLFGRTISVTSFPALTNSGDLIILRNAAGETIHAVAYTDAWYANAVKSEGGWSLEMVDLQKPCLGAANWKSSTNPSGGTPGRPNSVAGIVADNAPPLVTNSYALQHDVLAVRWSEPLTQASLSPDRFVLAPGIAVVAASLQPPLFDVIQIQLASPLIAGTIYQLQVSNLSDCAGNSSGTITQPVALPQAIDSFDVIINELLFDPPPLGQDYIELLNRSNKVVDAATLRIANRSSSSGQVGSITSLFNEPRLMFPGDYFAFTIDTAIILQQYRLANRSRLFQLPGMPSFPNDRGWALLLNNIGNRIDELPYSDKWHFALLSNPEGVALERISANLPTADKDNWTSAAAAAGFGTPTAANSQQRSGSVQAGSVSINPKVFSPDNDGLDDYCMIQIDPGAPGFTVNITIFDAQGRPVRVLQRNTTLGNSASFRWDGLNDRQQRLPPGNYVVLCEWFNLQGERYQHKTVVVIAVRF